MADVYHYDSFDRECLAKLKSELKKAFAGCRNIAIKIHFGEPGNTAAFTPKDVKPICDLLYELGINYFFFDSPVKYGGIRGKSDSYKLYAVKKGFGDVKISDESVPVKMEHLTYEVCRDLIDADGVLILSHFKGHDCSGFGGSIKNLGMGALSKKSKTDIHDGGAVVYTKDCALCGACVESCPINGINIDKGHPEFGECWGCSNCASVCPNECIKVKLKNFDFLLSEGAFAAYKNFKKSYSINVLKNITKSCDCFSNVSKIIAKDSGIVFSSDIVAVDKASHDIVVKNAGEDVFLKNNKKTGLEHVFYAEKLGMGSATYKLINE